MMNDKLEKQNICKGMYFYYNQEPSRTNAEREEGECVRDPRQDILKEIGR